MPWNVLLGPAITLLSKIWNWRGEKAKKHEDEIWGKKFTNAVSALRNALPRTLTEKGITPGFKALIPDEEMRYRIENYLIEPQQIYSSQIVRARTVSPEQLRNPLVRQTIQDVLDCVETLKREKPEIAARLHLTA